MRIWFSGPRIGFLRPGVSFALGARHQTYHQPNAFAASGFVYIIARDGDARIKIGSSVDPFRRLGELQTGSPDQLSIVYKVPIAGGASTVEARAHEILDRHRGLGEWFSVSIDVAVAAIHAAAYQVGSEASHEVILRPPRISMQAYLVGLLIFFVLIGAFSPKAKSEETSPRAKIAEMLAFVRLASLECSTGDDDTRGVSAIGLSIMIKPEIQEDEVLPQMDVIENLKQRLGQKKWCELYGAEMAEADIIFKHASEK
jgi:hypothetical protein